MTQISKKALKDLAKALDTRIDHKTPTQATITLATVIKAVKGDYWVQLDGAATSTPAVSSTVAVSVGDRVQVRIQDGKLTITGNATQQATNVAETVSIVEPIADTAEAAKVIADTASSKATDAKKIAQATSQHFYHDDQGAHVTTDTSNANLLANSQGVAVRAGENPLTTMGTSGFTIYDGQGGEEANVLAKFSSDGLDLGREGETHADIDASGLKLIDMSGNVYFEVKDLRDPTTGKLTIKETLQCLNSDEKSRVTPTYIISNITDIVDVTTGKSILDTANPEIVDDKLWVDGTYAYITITYDTSDTADYSKVYTLGTRIDNSVSGAMSIVEGYENIASGYFSHAQGNLTQATGQSSHAEGYRSVANGFGSHAQGSGTIANGENQMALGKYNKDDNENKYAVIIGGGSMRSRSNVLTIDWDGNIESAQLTAISEDVINNL